MYQEEKEYDKWELCYVWIDNYKILKEQSFNFSKDYEFNVSTVDNATYQIDMNEKEKLPDDFYGEVINNITAIVGENGSGKTSFIRFFRENLGDYGLTAGAGIACIIIFRGTNTLVEKSKEKNKNQVEETEEHTKFFVFSNILSERLAYGNSFKEVQNAKKFKSTERRNDIFYQGEYGGEEFNYVFFSNAFDFNEERINGSDENMINKSMNKFVEKVSEQKKDEKLYVSLKVQEFEDSLDFLRNYEMYNKLRNKVNAIPDSLKIRLKHDIKVGENINIGAVSQILEKHGYVKKNKVENKGEFSLETTCIEIYPPTKQTNYRISIKISKNKVISIKKTNLDTQEKLDKQQISISTLRVEEIINKRKKSITRFNNYEEKRANHTKNEFEEELCKHIIANLVLADEEIPEMDKGTMINDFIDLTIKIIEYIHDTKDIKLYEHFLDLLRCYKQLRDECLWQAVGKHIELDNYCMYFLVDDYFISSKTEQDSDNRDDKDKLNLQNLKDKIIDLYSSITKINTNYDFINISWNKDNGWFSTGQFARFRFYYNMYNLVTKEKNKKNIILFIDEPDVYMHPEWQRSYISDLVEFLNIVFDKGDNVQVIISTNGPFILSDIPVQNINFLHNKNSKEGRKIDKTEQTFAANIHTLLTKSFFMERTIGEFAYKKITNIFQQLQGNDPLDESDQESIKRQIEIIGEPIIRNKLEQLYKEKIERQQDNIDKEIKILEKRIDELRARKKEDGETNDKN